jgi:aspartate/methionine/tyrosine aminotransferase
MRPCTRMQQVQAPIIPIMGEWIRQHPGTISLGQGVVGYGPPPEVAARINDFMGQAQLHKYHAVTGLPELRESISQKLDQENGIQLKRGQSNQGYALCVTAGANMGFMNAVLAITDPGDEIILLRPFYFNHEMAVQIAGCVPVVVDTDAAYQPIPDRIAERITERTRAVVTISPNNPTGVVYSRAVLQEINTLCRKRGIFHIHDEAYEYFTYNETEHFSPGSIPDSSAHTISLYSLSKAYGFASWRIGYMVFPAILEVSIKKIQDTILICAPVISQQAALGALQAGRAYCRAKQAVLHEVRPTVLQALDGIRDLCQVQRPDGAFYCFLKIETQLSALGLTERLVREFGVAVIPGETFGATKGCYLRISYGPLDKDITALGLERLVRGLKAIVQGSET